MFSSKSRYAKAETYLVNGTTVAVRLPIRPRPTERTQHERLEGQRLDLIAAQYLGDATAFYRLCDASDTIAPDALAARPRIPIPDKGG